MAQGSVLAYIVARCAHLERERAARRPDQVRLGVTGDVPGRDHGVLGFQEDLAVLVGQHGAKGMVAVLT